MFEDFGIYDGVFQSIFDSQFSQILYEYEVAVVKSNANKDYLDPIVSSLYRMGTIFAKFLQRHKLQKLCPSRKAIPL